MVESDKFVGYIVKQINDALNNEEGLTLYPGVRMRMGGSIDLTYRRNDISYNVSISYNAHQIRIAEVVGFNEKGSTTVELIDFPTVFARSEFVRNLFPDDLPDVAPPKEPEKQ